MCLLGVENFAPFIISAKRKIAQSLIIDITTNILRVLDFFLLVGFFLAA